MNYLRIILIAIIVILPIFIILRAENPKSSGNSTSDIASLYKKTAGGIMETCKSETNNLDNCYSEQFYKIAQKNDFDFIIGVLRKLNKLDNRSKNCHVIAHYIATGVVGRNPSIWKELLEREDISLCGGGFIHGVVEAHQKQDPHFELTPEYVGRTCGSIKYEIKQKGGEEGCIHVMGHLALAENQGDVNRAVNFCLGAKEGMESECLAGAFMENITRENLTIHAGLPKLEWNDENIRNQESICQNYSGFIAQTCWREMAHMYVGKYESVVKAYSLCERAGQKDYINYCYDHVMQLVAPVVTESDLDLICSPHKVSKARYEYCIRTAIFFLLSGSGKLDMDRALKLCGLNKNSYCYQSIGKSLAHFTTSDEIKKLCKSAPGEYIKDCMINL